MDLLARLYEGRLDDATARRLQQAVRTWMASATKGRRSVDGRIERGREMTLAACLGLQESPGRARILLRDFYLREAAQSLPGNGSKAGRLFEEAGRFSGHQWGCWIDLPEPPAYATELQRSLFFAMKAGGGRLPSTRRQFENIVKA